MPVRPFIERFAVGAESAGGQHLYFWGAPRQSHESIRGPRRGLAHADRFLDLVQRLAVGAGLQERGLIA
jgi:hypothetical protein